MKKENTNNIENILQDIENILHEYAQAKAEKKHANAVLQKENIIKMADKLNIHAISMVLKNKDKRGLVHLYASESDLFKYYLKPFYESNGITFKKIEDQIKVQIDIESDFNILQDFKKWALNKIESNKQKEKEKKLSLEKVKTGVHFEKMDKKTLQAVILQARQALAKIKD